MDFLKHQNESSTGWEELQEPVPFEDFKFSFGLDPDFSIPLPLETPTSTSTNASSTLSSVDPMLTDEIFPSFDLYTQEPPSLNSVVLDEQDQKTFSNFLDTFFMDPPSTNTLFDTHSTSPTASTNYFMPALNGFQANDDNDMEEQRRNSILQSLDHQKQKLHDRLNFLATTTTPPEGAASPTSKKRMFSSSSSTSNTKKHKSEHSHHHHHHKELLTEEEKRANHIASEQKRRSTIRTGFKDLTEIIPTLKNIHHSKSTVLFKAVDFIKYLDRRNKCKREKLQQLQLRLQLKQQQQWPSSSSPPPPPQQQQHSPTTSTSSLATPPNVTSLPPNVSAALRAHKSQQAQLLQLQEQLQLHQRLLARRQSMQELSSSTTTMTLPPLHRQPPPPPKAGFRAVMHDADDDSFFKPTLSA